VDILGYNSNISAKVTVFAPTNAAFDKLFQQFNITAEDLYEDSEYVFDLMEYHVLPTVFDARMLFLTASVLLQAEPDFKFNTLYSGEYLTWPYVPGDTNADRLGVSYNPASSEITMIGAASEATIVEADIWSCSAVVHVIDNVLLSEPELWGD